MIKCWICLKSCFLLLLLSNKARSDRIPVCWKPLVHLVQSFLCLIFDPENNRVHVLDFSILRKNPWNVFCCTLCQWCWKTSGPDNIISGMCCQLNKKKKSIYINKYKTGSTWAVRLSPYLVHPPQPPITLNLDVMVTPFGTLSQSARLPCRYTRTFPPFYLWQALDYDCMSQRERPPWEQGQNKSAEEDPMFPQWEHNSQHWCDPWQEVQFSTFITPFLSSNI